MDEPASQCSYKSKGASSYKTFMRAFSFSSFFPSWGFFRATIAAAHLDFVTTERRLIGYKALDAQKILSVGGWQTVVEMVVIS